MTAFIRKPVFYAALAFLALTLGAAPARAEVGQCMCPATPKPHKVHHHTVVRHRHASRHVAAGSMDVRTAQQHLSNLGYYSGAIDGVMGSETRDSLKHFQREYGLKADGILGPKTRRALEEADRRTYGTRSIPLILQNGPGYSAAATTVNPDFVPRLNGGSNGLNSRFGKIEVNESGEGPRKRYAVTLNGQAVLNADDQPSVMGLSPVYQLGDVDAIIFTTFGPDGQGCIYRHNVLVLNATGSRLLDMPNCTRDYQAEVHQNQLFIVFPEKDDGRAVGATWRLDQMDLERL